MKMQFKILASVALVALICLGAIGVAQTTAGDGGERDKKVEKTIEIVEENGEKKMTVTTTEDGTTTVETFTGDEVDAYLRKESHSGTHGDHMNMWISDDDAHGAMKIRIQTNEDGEVVTEDINVGEMLNGMDFTFLENLEGMEDADMEEIHKAVEEAMGELENLNIDIDMQEGEDGVFIINTDVDGEDGENVHARVMISGGEHGNTWNDEDGTITIEIDEESNGENTHKKVVIMSKVCVIEDLDEEEAAKMGDAAPTTNNDLKIKELKFYPNPTEGQFTLEFEVTEKGVTEISVTDMEGKEVFRDKARGSGTHVQQIDISNEASGVYLLNLRQGDKSTVKKIVLD